MKKQPSIEGLNLELPSGQTTRDISFDLAYVGSAKVHNFIVESLIFSSSYCVGVEFTDCRFSDTFLRESEFRKCKFVRCSFNNCKLQEMSFDACLFEDTDFNNSQFLQASFYGSKLNKVLFQSIKSEQTIFNHCELDEVDATEIANISTYATSLARVEQTPDERTMKMLERFGAKIEYEIKPEWLNSWSD